MIKVARESRIVVLAAVAHPDDIEFMMAGTLLQLKAVGAEIHMWNLANGNCGTAVHDSSKIVRLRAQEARDSARVIGARAHPALVNDVALFYEPKLLAKVGAVVRQVKPTIILTQSPCDYMEDHQNTCRLIVSAAFVRGIRNFKTSPKVATWSGNTALYHAVPHGLRDGLRALVRSGQYVDISSVLAKKREMLSRHKTQKEWLAVSQDMDSYLKEMEVMSRALGRMSGRFEYAEGWRRHSHLGFGPADYDPLSEMLGNACWTDPDYEKALEMNQ
ncbi:MAG: PIG-L family deacetylase [Planctomycetota bacterium]